jgi:hypothetical protein
MTRFDSDWGPVKRDGGLTAESLPTAGVWEIVLSDIPIVRAADPELAAVGRAASLGDGMRPRQLGKTHAFSRP